MEESAQTYPHDRIQGRTPFMMGHGKLVPREVSKRFCNSIVNGCLDGQHATYYQFCLGFAACFDAVSRGTIDLQADPNAIVDLAWRDVNNVSSKPNEITAIMSVGDE